MSDVPMPDMDSDSADKGSSAWLRTEAIVDQFEAAWQEHGDADPADFLPGPDEPCRLDVLLELVKVDLEYRWGREQQVVVEHYLERFPELRQRDGLVADLVGEELRVRRFHERPTTAAELARRFPNLEGKFSSLHEDPVTVGGTTLGTRRSPCAGLDGTPAAAPRQLGRYQVHALLGRGGFGSVYLGWDAELKREVAIKVPRAEFLPDEEGRGRMLREAQSAARLRHPSIVPVYEAGLSAEQAYIVYERLPGPSLAEIVAQAPPAPQQAAEWIACIAEALDCAHRNGIVHRDVKPANILLNAERRPMLADFGLALQIDGVSLTRHGDVLGTPAYMSPEQAGGDAHRVDGRSDIYSLGVAFYELLTGRVPFAGNMASVLRRVIHEEPLQPRQLRSEVPRDLETICLKAIAKEPGRRYASAAEFAEDLRRYLRREPIRARRVGPLGRGLLWCRRKPALAATIGLALCVVLAVASVGLWRVVEERNRYRAEHEQALVNLYQSLVGEARALRLARGTGYREAAWSRLEQALALETPARDRNALRQEAVAGMGDFVALAPRAWDMFGFHHRFVVALAIQPGGRRAAFGVYDGSIELRELESGEQSALLQAGKNGVYALVFSEDGKSLFAADDGGGIHTWQQEDDGTWRRGPSRSMAAGVRPQHVNAASLALSADGKRLFGCGFGAPAVSIWDLTHAGPAKPLRRPLDEVYLSVAVDGQERWIAASYHSSKVDGVVLWDAKTRLFAAELKPGLGMAKRVAFSGDGRLLACACEEGIAVYRTPLGTGKEFEPHLFVRGDNPYMVAFSPDNKRLAIPSPHRGVLRIWDVLVNREIAVLRHVGEPHAAAFSDDGRTLVSASANHVRLWSMQGSGEKVALAGHRARITQVAFASHGEALVSASVDRSVRFWGLDGKSLKELDSFAHPVRAVAVAPDRPLMVTAELRGGVTAWDITDVRKPRSLGRLEHSLAGEVRSAKFGAKGGYLALGSKEAVQIWRSDAAAPTRLASWKHIRCEEPLCLSFSDDERFLVWRDQGGRRHLLDLLDGIHRLLEHEETVPGRGIVFLPGGHEVVVAHGESADLIDVTTGKVTQGLGKVQLLGEGNWYTGVEIALHPAGKLLALQHFRVPLWDLQRKTTLFALPGEAEAPTFLEWSPDGARLAIGCDDGSLVLWDLPRLRGHLRQLGLDWHSR